MTDSAYQKYSILLRATEQESGKGYTEQIKLLKADFKPIAVLSMTAKPITMLSHHFSRLLIGRKLHNSPRLIVGYSLENNYLVRSITSPIVKTMKDVFR